MSKKVRYMTLFDIIDDNDFKKITDGKKYNINPIILDEKVVCRLKNYKLDDYISDVECLGLEKTWDYICQFAIDNKDQLPDFFEIKNFGELYEIGLAIQDKILKKKSGQYYTPDDVAQIMSEWLYKCEGEAVCDVACGTGKLILTYLELIGYENARKLISSGNLYLYDFDHITLKICRTTIAIKYGLDIADSINDIFCDFLDRSIKLPNNCKVISNPPYAKIDVIQDYWEQNDVLFDTKELYSAFMDKIFRQAKSTVIITPFSFISGTKFYSLRNEMCSLGSGFIVAFDNVPGNIFCGRKHGIFNTNTANSVRAAITVMRQDVVNHGFRISPLIRFKNEERKSLLKCDVLENLLSSEYQIINERNDKFKKIDKNLYNIFLAWTEKSSYKLKDFLSTHDTEYLINMPNTCRYFTTGSSRKLNRTGSIELYVDSEDAFNFIHCFINSSFTYWWWRVYDGGITYPISLLNAMPLPFNLLDDSDKIFFSNMSKRLSEEEKKYIVTKLNAGNSQENIKFPDEYRIEINNRILKILGFSAEKNIFQSVHANKFFME